MHKDFVLFRSFPAHETEHQRGGKGEIAISLFTLALISILSPGVRWEILIKNYMEWGDDFRVQVLANGQVYFTSNQNRYLVDTDRDCWPISMNSRTGDTVLIEQEVELTKVDGQWLPDPAEVQAVG